MSTDNRLHPSFRLAALGVVLASALLVVPANAQSLFLTEAAPKTEEGKDPDPQEPLKSTSLTMVEAPKPRDFAIHDLVTIIVQEQSRQSSTAKLDTKKDASIKGKINKLPDVADLLQLMLDSTDTAPQVEVGADGQQSFKGDGKYERTERLTDKIQATIIDVKPNGTLVLEAKRTIAKDQEVQTMVLSGMCRREDVTGSNTILSSQLADLTVGVESTGEVKDTASKGFFTRVFEVIFNF
ncbi:MAG: flagellar basal body L-ring protein FlgH [Phycisphaerales bacterium]